MNLERNKFSFIHPRANVHENAYIDSYTTIGKGVKIESDVYISNGAKIYGNALVQAGSYIGENCIIGHPQRGDLSQIIKEKKAPTEHQSPLVTIGRDCTIRAGTIIYSEVSIGQKCQTGHNVMIREKTNVGNNSLIGTNTIIDGNVVIGAEVSIQTGVYIPLYCKIGNNVFMGPFSKLTNDKYMKRREFALLGPIIEDNVSLGANSVILPGITLKKGTIVGAGSVVTKNTNENDIVVGNPAKLLKKKPEDWK
ncbi:MAG: N-acetyltransferase [Candidatus Lokiarchaeota archaeon]|nr:N-acetyltransferase [Candidatus Lokiarchaeota archaeon]